MTFQEITARLASFVDDRLPAGNPLRGNLTAVMADPKEGGNTWGVLEATGSGRDLIPGNYTMQTDARLYAQIVPTEGQWSALQLEAFFEETAQALVSGIDELMLPSNAAGDRWLVLGCQCTGGGEIKAERSIGYTLEIPFLLTVQF
jgi:hypothetical protein